MLTLRTFSPLLLALPLWTSACGNQITAAGGSPALWEYRVVPLVELVGTSDPFAMLAQAAESARERAPEGPEPSFFELPGEVARSVAERMQAELNTLGAEGWELMELSAAAELQVLVLRRAAR